MITTNIPGRTFLHNGDFSGDLIIVCHPEEVVESPGPPGHLPTVQVTIPFDQIKALVAEYVRQEKISALENASDDYILGNDPEQGS